MTKATLTIADRIARAQPALSRKQHEMAEYVLAHQFRVATMTIDEFAAAIACGGDSPHAHLHCSLF